MVHLSETIFSGVLISCSSVCVSRTVCKWSVFTIIKEQCFKWQHRRRYVSPSLIGSELVVYQPVWSPVCRPGSGPRRWAPSVSTAAWSCRLEVASATQRCTCRSKTPEHRPSLRRHGGQRSHGDQFSFLFHDNKAWTMFQQGSKSLIHPVWCVSCHHVKSVL